ncbi:hypothetical protein LAUMK13_02300 [Mycobacterium innocens]|uniref:Uncharacterized protein n=1 Tax=Mycobacterium innocens TaxID=2341083 RepID=A0A498Q0Q5_9MYCO|nr:hypothetical protein LAUMK13_02300 [Mycobacterium innocens]
MSLLLLPDTGTVIRGTRGVYTGHLNADGRTREAEPQLASLSRLSIGTVTSLEPYVGEATRDW